jgi:hypothetical protein
MNNSTFRSTRVAIAALGTAAFAMVLSAPTAGAAVNAINIDPAVSVGLSGQFGTGCTYTITASVTNGTPVYFGSTALGVFNPVVANPVNGKATTQWTPKQTGNYLVTASTNEGDNVSFQNAHVTVGTGVPAGPACVVV